jgi:two-component system chemotaxis sensor kinase CheA
MRRATPGEERLFSSETQKRVTTIRQQLQDLKSLGGGELEEEINSIFREMHSLKGAANAIGIPPVVTLAHKAEDLLDELRTKQCAPSPDLSALFLLILGHIQAIAQNLHLATMIDITPIIRKVDSHLGTS